MNLIKKNLKEVIVAMFFLGGYAFQFHYMDSQLTYLTAKVDVVENQNYTQEAKIDSAIDQLSWLRGRIK